MTPTPPSAGSGSGDSATEKLAQHLSLLLAVIRSQRWPSFDRIALSNPHVFHMISDALPRHEGASILHVCLRHDPPAELVVKMLNLIPDRAAALRSRDNEGRTPLHVAVACQADPMVVKLLASVDPSTCGAVDDDGRTPLHLACDAPQDEPETNSEEEEPSPESQDRQLETVRALLSESLDPTQVEDADDMSPLEHAILSDAPIRVVKLLQKATMECLRRRSGDGATKRRKVLEGSPSSMEVSGAAEVGSQGRSVARKVSM